VLFAARLVNACILRVIYARVTDVGDSLGVVLKRFGLATLAVGTHWFCSRLVTLDCAVPATVAASVPAETLAFPGIVPGGNVAILPVAAILQRMAARLRPKAWYLD
jgi:hypothetical protein